jgi:hypothetical protein
LKKPITKKDCVMAQSVGPKFFTAKKNLKRRDAMSKPVLCCSCQRCRTQIWTQGNIRWTRLRHSLQSRWPIIFKCTKD